MFDLDDVLESMDPDNSFDDRKAKLENAAYPGAKFVYKYEFLPTTACAASQSR